MRKKILLMAVIVTIAVVYKSYADFPADAAYPQAAEDPVVDGTFSSSLEYVNANKVRDILDVGYFYKEHKENWTVNGTTYSNTMSFFNTHYFTDSGYGQLDGYDLNSFEVKWGGITITTWVFLAGDNTPDEWWLQAVGLGGYTELNDDGGFLVRLNNDSTTDRIWQVGDPMPGDADWDFSYYYGVFAYGGFNNSAYTNGYSTVSDDREIYEWSITLNRDLLANQILGLGAIQGVAGGEGNPLAPGVCDPYWELQIEWVKVCDWKPEMGGYGTYGGPGWVPVEKWVLMGFDDTMHPSPEPTTILLLTLGGMLLRRRR